MTSNIRLLIFLNKHKKVSSFGSLACSVVTTTRKFLSVLYSVLFKGNHASPLQWFGAVLVFSGLFADAFFGKNRKPTQQQTNQAENK